MQQEIASFKQCELFDKAKETMTILSCSRETSRVQFHNFSINRVCIKMTEEVCVCGGGGGGCYLCHTPLPSSLVDNR